MTPSGPFPDGASTVGRAQDCHMAQIAHFLFIFPGCASIRLGGGRLILSHVRERCFARRLPDNNGKIEMPAQISFGRGGGRHFVTPGLAPKPNRTPPHGGIEGKSPILCTPGLGPHDQVRHRVLEHAGALGGPGGGCPRAACVVLTVETSIRRRMGVGSLPLLFYRRVQPRWFPSFLAPGRRTGAS